MRLARNVQPMPRRAGFTLTEILVVIAIMAILAALLGAGIMTWMGGQSRRNTESNFRTAFKLLQQQWSAVIDDAKKEDISGITALQNLAAPDTANQRARLIWIKARLMEAFPQNFNEAISPPSLIPTTRRKYIAAYTRAVNAAVASGNHNANTEAAACLALALSTSHAGKSVSLDDLKAICLDTDGDGMKEVVDGFRQPAGFVRFSTDLTTPGLQAANPAPAGSAAYRFADPLDAQGLLLNPNWYSTKAGSNCVTYQTYFGYQISPDNGQSEYYVLPVIGSAGPDGTFGTNDDIYSFQLR